MKIYKYIFPIKILFFCCIFNLDTLGQNNIFFTDPVHLSNHINSNAHEKMPLLSPDGTILYFTRSSTGQNVEPSVQTLSIWYSLQYGEGNWDKIKKATDNINNNNQNTIVGFAGNGVGLYVLNKKKPDAKKSKLGISFLHDSVWSKPVNILKYKIPNLHDLYVHPSEKIIVLSMEAQDGYGKTDLYVSFKDSDNRWTTPINLGATVNSFDAEISPFLTADGSRLYFASNGHKGYGDMDIFYCDRLYDTWNIWSSPQNLGKRINSEHFDAYFSISTNGKAFFVSNRNEKSLDIYTSELLLPDTGHNSNNEVREIGNEENNAHNLFSHEPSEILGLPANPIIFFNKNSFEILPEQREFLLFIADRLSRLNDFKVLLIGHADNEGSEEYNLKLSEDRAISVKNLFVYQGVDPDRIEVVAKGENDPINRNTSEMEKAKNRRVEILILKKS